MKKIYAICTTLDAGNYYDKEKIIENGIQVGDKIELEDAAVGGFHTKVYLKGYKGSFNSVFFDFVDESDKDYNIYEDINFATYR